MMKKSYIQTFFTHLSGAVLLVCVKCLIQSTTDGSLNLVICLNDPKGENAICSPPEWHWMFCCMSVHGNVSLMKVLTVVK